MTTAPVNGQKVHFHDTEGPGPVVVFSHGTLLDADMWQPQFDALSASFRCIAWDRRLHGRTEDDGTAYTDWDSARDLFALLDHLDVERAHLVGHSQGGAVSLRAALLAPDRVASLVLSDTMAASWPPETVATMSGAIGGLRGPGPDAVAPGLLPGLLGRSDLHPEWLAKWKAQPKDRLADALANLLAADDVTGRIGEIAAPTFGIHGEADPIIPLAAGQALHSGLSGSIGLLIIPGAVHTPTLTHPDQVNAPVLEFLRSV